MQWTVDCYPSGDQCLIMRFGSGAGTDLQQHMIQFMTYLTRHPFTGFLEAVPSNHTIAVFYDAKAVSYGLTTTRSDQVLPYEWVQDYLYACMKAFQSELPHPSTAIKSVIDIPVCYELNFALDLEDIAKDKGVSQDSIIQWHSEQTYTVLQLGFLPGFPYLGSLDDRLITARRNEPRTKVPAGSVGIAGHQTCIYPEDSPGGWNIIGRTPIKLFDTQADPPALLQMGDTVRFYPISAEAFRAAEMSSAGEVMPR